MNNVCIIGNLTRDPRRKDYANGTLALFTLAVPKNYLRDKNHHKTASSVNYIPVKCWNRLAENVVLYCHKGSLVSVEGQIESRTYEDRNGNRRTAIEICASKVQFLSFKSKPDGAVESSLRNKAKKPKDDLSEKRGSFLGSENGDSGEKPSETVSIRESSNQNEKDIQERVNRLEKKYDGFDVAYDEFNEKTLDNSDDRKFYGKQDDEVEEPSSDSELRSKESDSDIFFINLDELNYDFYDESDEESYPVDSEEKDFYGK